MKIGIAGCGGIGSNVAVNLVRSRVNWLKLADFDRVEPGNLNRQFYFSDQIGQPKVAALADNLKRISPQMIVLSDLIKLDEHNTLPFFEECDIIVEGFDQPQSKKMLLESFAGSNKLIVSACGIAGTELESIRVKVMANSSIVGDFCSDIKEHKVYAPKVQMIASWMSHLVLTKEGLYE